MAAAAEPVAIPGVQVFKRAASGKAILVRFPSGKEGWVPTAHIDARSPIPASVTGQATGELRVARWLYDKNRHEWGLPPADGSRPTERPAPDQAPTLQVIAPPSWGIPFTQQGPPPGWGTRPPVPPRVANKDPDLSPDQQRALDRLIQGVIAGESPMVVTGPAGSGKTTLMRRLAKAIRALPNTVIGSMVTVGTDTAPRTLTVTSVKPVTTGRSSSRALADDDDGWDDDYDYDNWVDGAVSAPPAAPPSNVPMRNAIFMAPTGRAAVRIGQAAGEEATTIHRALYRKLTDVEYTDPSTGKKKTRPVFMDPQPPCGAGDVACADEGSMIGSKLYGDLTKAIHDTRGALIVFGDKEQLEPVGDTWGPNFASPTVTLTVVHRQGVDNPILALATAIRTGGVFSWDLADYRTRWIKGGYWDAAYWLAARRWVEPDCDTVLLCYGNDARRQINAMVRYLLGRAPLDRLTWGWQHWICRGDRLLVLANNYYRGWMNGEVYTVEDVMVDPEDAGVLVVRFVDDTEDRIARIIMGYVGAEAGEFRKHLKHLEDVVLGGMSPGDRDAFRSMGVIPHYAEAAVSRLTSFVHIDYGEAITVHKFQGSEATEVGFVYDSVAKGLATRRISEFKRLYYTAVTRARDLFYVWDIT